MTGGAIACLSAVAIVVLAQSGTAGAQGDPAIGTVSAAPANPTPAQTVTVSAAIDAADSPMLVFRVGFAAESQVAMVDDGTNGDAAAGDGTWTAQIPAQAAGSLIRYRVVDAPAAAPSAADGRNYFGLTVADAGVSTAMPLVEWFIPEADYDSMFDDPTQVVEVEGSVLAVDGEVFDNVKVRILGNTFDRNNWDKQDIEVVLPDGSTLDPGIADYALDTFALGSERGFSFGRENGAWSVFEAAGFPTVHAEHVHVRRNGDFYGVYRLTERLDQRWLSENGLTGSFYEARDAAFLAPGGFLKVQPADEDLEPVQALSDALNMPASPLRDAYVYRNIDIPQAVNFLAAARLSGHLNSGPYGFALHEDVNGTGLWQIYPYDMSNSFGVPSGICTGAELDLSCSENPIWTALRSIPEIEEMVNRRIRTLLAGPMAEGVLVDEFTAYQTRVSTAERNADIAAWPVALDGGYFTVGGFGTEVDVRRNAFDALGSVPPAQVAEPGIIINEIRYAPSAGGAEFVELFNPTGVAVDLSGWQLEGLGLTFAEGTAIASNGFLLVVDDVLTFQAEYSSVNDVVLVAAPGELADAGETIALENADDTTIDSVTFVATAPWPTGAVGTGNSIELISTLLDNNSGASWQRSIAANGSPGAVSGEAPPPPELCFGVPVTVNLELGDDPTDGPDVILGTDGDDNINALGGDDIVCAGAGDDLVLAGSGDDKVSGGSGADGIFGGIGIDRLFGQDGDDVIHGQDGRDRIAGGAGNDELHGGANRDLIDGNRGRDVIFGGSARDRIQGGSGNDVIEGNGGNDRLKGGGGNNDIVNAGRGIDLCIDFENEKNCER